MLGMHKIFVNFGCIILVLFCFLSVLSKPCSALLPRVPKRQRLLIQQLTAPINHGEGPHWDASKQVLFFVDIAGQKVYQYDPYTKKLTFAHIGEEVGAVFPVRGTKNKFIVGAGRYLAVLTWNGLNTTKPFVQILNSVDENKPGNRFNDGKVDASGRLWIGTMGPEKPIGNVVPNQGTLFRMSSNSCKLEPVITNVSISNGIAWSLDNKFMYYIDSFTRRIDKLDYNILTGSISNRRTLLDFEKAGIAGAPDGMTIDNRGNLWVACWGGSQILNIDSNTGHVIYSVQMPVERVTSLTFGGAYYDILFVTTSKLGLTELQLRSQPAAGALFSISNLPTIGHYNVPASNCARIPDH